MAVAASLDLREAELLDAVADLIAIDAEQLRRMRLIAAGPFEGLDEELPLDLFELDAFGRQRRIRPERPCGSA